MIELSTRKGSGGMTHRAVLAGRNMVGIGLGVFTRRRNTIMAGRAVIYDISMVKHRWCKGTAGYVTGSAILICKNVVWLGILAGGIDAIVAGVATQIDHFRSSVVNKCIKEICGVVA